MTELYEFTAELGDDEERNAQVAGADWDYLDAKKKDQSAAIAMLHSTDYFTNTSVEDLWLKVDVLAEIVKAHESGMIGDTTEIMEATRHHYDALITHLCSLPDIEIAS
jgi:hypothetical protein